MQILSPTGVQHKLFTETEGSNEFRSLFKRVCRAGGRAIASAENLDRAEASELLRLLDRSPLIDVGFTPISGLLGGVLGEIGRRCALRQRLEVELGQIDDAKFLAIADRSGVRI